MTYSAACVNTCIDQNRKVFVPSDLKNAAEMSCEDKPT